MYKKLIVVSDTAMLKNSKENLAFGPVVDELEFIESLFDKIIWIGYHFPEKENDKSMKIIKKSKIKLVMLPQIGGKSILSKLNIILRYPVLFFVILRYVFFAPVIHTRGPSHPAFIAIVISFFIRKKIWWHKFAGSWDESTLPFFYVFQKRILQKYKHVNVTINGFWNDQPEHCFSFENPSLNEIDIRRGEEIFKNKTYTEPFVFCFVGRVDEAKGMHQVISVLKGISTDKIEVVHIVGDGPKIGMYKEALRFLGSKVVFHGFLEKNEVHSIYEVSHFLLLPSASEGFPKVVAEAACYGVIPIVSNVGSISHYINDKNGFLWNIGNENYDMVFLKAISENEILLKERATILLPLAKKFTFTEYFKKLKNTILKDD
ncbi:Glycosyltransferase involved in cell wall bisynthesis [Flavobacterium sp. 9AF]|uniref:glycosyltransferase family 4 protein n=1 Tax=Flavobacterium sp. 9AF TaxID=2653142 RepID=UPI0012F25FF3|nr:glycosyltransferase family 4 protein [Flavobacterium sp. 9AF]VXC31776.1 Glycosyltransferase involved in cell wall bisynthesis [Flavobacterium sp. 9AF]